MSSRSIWPVALFSALLGGGLAVVIAAVAGVGGKDTTTTVVQQSALSNTRSADTKSSQTVSQIYTRDAPGVAYIRANVVQQSTSSFGFPQTQQGEATGSGFVIDTKGTILTNAHVIDGATKVTVQFGESKRIDAKILGKDRSTDLAVLRVDPSGLNLRPLALGSASDVQVGDPVVAIGNPFGLSRTLTTGVVSAKQRSIPGLNQFQIDNVIQTDAAINPGNSGGPLIDAAGEVIGINSQIETGNGNSNGNIGIGFAIPIDTARRLLPGLLKGAVTTGYLGISASTIDSSLSGLNLPVDKGALVQKVEADSPASKAGIKAGDLPAQIAGQDVTLGGDIIVKIDGKAIASSEALSAYVASQRKGDQIKVEFVRGGKHQTVTVTLAARPQGTVGTDSQTQQTP